MKPGMVCGNFISASTGFLFASTGHSNPGLLLGSASGISLLVASACILNNVIDRDIDLLMQRTRSRPVASGRIPARHAMLLSAAAACAGTFLLGPGLPLALVLSGHFVYVILYSLLLKRRTSHAILMGSLAGATPPLAGYCAGAGGIDTAAILLFLLYFLWQIPHFISIAIFRIEDYAAASIPVLPIQIGIPSAKTRLALWIVPFSFSAILPAVLGHAGRFYFLAAIALCMTWMTMALTPVKNVRAWAVRMFIFSIFILFSLNLTIFLDRN